jgi:hypothetical protein
MLKAASKLSLFSKEMPLSLDFISLKRGLDLFFSDEQPITPKRSGKNNKA